MRHHLNILLTFSIILPGLIAGATALHGRDLENAVAAVPNPRVASGGWVSDPAGAISARQTDINALISELERETSAEIAVVVLPSIGEFVPKEFATELFNHWGVGKKGKDNGILVLQVLDQRRIEIETGYGLEGALPDVKCRWIIDDIAIPYFKAGSFSDGHFEVVRALIRGIRNENSSRPILVGALVTQPGVSVDPPAAEYELPHTQASVTDFNSDTLTGLASIFPFPVGLAMLIWAAFSYRRFRRKNPEPYEEYNFYKENSVLAYIGTTLVSGAPGAWEIQSLESGWSLLAIIPGLLLTNRKREKHLKQLREKPRVDPKTGETMRRLSETDDDAYLEAGNVSEERIGSLDYDVWLSPSGFHKIERYDGHTSASKCDACGYKTYRQTSSRTIYAATTSSSGLAEDTYECAHCGRTEVVQRTIPKIETSSSSGGSSGGGGSFGGGSSGGGGSGGSY